MKLTRQTDPAAAVDLDADQMAAVKSTGTTLLVAAAGSGKTRVLTSKIVHLIQDTGIPQGEILAFTFTNKAADEMKNRLGQQLGIEIGKFEPNKPWISTMHSFCYRVLREDLISYDPDYAPRIQTLDDFKARRMIEEILKKLGYDEESDAWEPLLYLGQISSAVSAGYTYETAVELFYGEDSTPRDALTYQIWGEYIKAKKRGDSRGKFIDFNDMIVLTYKMFRDKPAIARKWSKRFQWVMVDEFQDTDTLQAKIVANLAETHGNLFAVGDHRQCFPAGTMVRMGDGTAKAIETIVKGDSVATPVRKLGVTKSFVNEVYKTKKETLLKIKLASGTEFLTTPEHRIPVHSVIVGYNNPAEWYYVYVMKKGNFGWRVGVTKNIWSRRTGERPDHMKILRSFKTKRDALLFESWISLVYCIPTQTYHRHGGEVISEETLYELYGKLGDHHLSGVSRMLSDFPELNDVDNVPVSNNGAKRQVSEFDPGRLPVVYLNLNDSVKLHTDLKSKRARKYIDRSSILHGVVLDVDGSQTRRSFASYSSAQQYARKLAEECGGCVQENVHIPHMKSHRQVIVVPARGLHRGFRLFRAIKLDEPLKAKRPPYNRVNYTIVPDEIVDIEVITGEVDVYDLEVDQTHLYFANDVVVHNSIYGFRGAQVDLTINFPDHFPNGKVLYMSRNYRSSSQVVEAGNSIIQHAAFDAPDCVANNAATGGVEFLAHYPDDVMEADEVTGIMRDEIEGGASPGDFAVLYRTNAQSAAIEDALIRKGLPYVILGSTGFYGREEIKDMVAYMAVIDWIDTENDTTQEAVTRLLKTKWGFETDYGAFERIINRPNRYLGRAFTQEWARRVKNGEDPYEALRRGGYSKSYMSRNAQQFASKLKQLLDAYRMKPDLSRLISNIRSMFGYDKFISKNFSSSVENPKIENLDTLQGKMIDFDDLTGFLIYASSAAKPESDSTERRAITLLTVHRSKGLEFKTVFVIGLSDGTLPHWRSLMEGDKGIEEERRVTYVAVTRAEERAFLSSCGRRTGMSREFQPSRFLQELAVLDTAA